MSIPRIVADRSVLDVRALVLAMMDVAEELCARRSKKTEKVKERLELIERDVTNFEHDYTVVDALHTYYEFDFLPSELRKYLTKIKENKYSEALDALSAMNKALKERIDERFREGIPETRLYRS